MGAAPATGLDLKEAVMLGVFASIAGKSRLAMARASEYEKIRNNRIEPLLFFMLPQRLASAARLTCAFRLGDVVVRARHQDLVAVEEIGLRKDYDFIRQFLRHDSRPTVVDAGANIGMFAAFVLSTCPDAVVHSIEAASDTFQLLSRNQRGNRGFRWSAHHLALWDEDGYVSFADKGSSTARRVLDDGSGIQVPSRTLASFLADVLSPRERIALCKIDIEGAEERVLRASLAELARMDHLIVEIHPTVSSLETVLAMLRDRFDTVVPVSQRESNKPLLHAFRSS